MAKLRRRAPTQWALQDAKNRLSEVIDAAARGQPQVVTRRGVKTAVVISYEEYARVTEARQGQAPSLAAYLLAMPTTPGGEAFERIETAPRAPDL